MTRAPAWCISKCYTISVSVLRIFPTTFVTMVICLVTFPFGRCFVGVSHPRLGGNEAKCLELNRVGIQDYSNRINRTHSKHFHKSLKCTSQVWVFKNVKNARDVNKGTLLAPNFTCSMCPSMRSYEIPSLRAYFEYTVAIIVRVAQDGIYFCSFVSHKITKNF